MPAKSGTMALKDFKQLYTSSGWHNHNAQLIEGFEIGDVLGRLDSGYCVTIGLPSWGSRSKDGARRLHQVWTVYQQALLIGSAPEVILRVVSSGTNHQT